MYRAWSNFPSQKATFHFIQNSSFSYWNGTHENELISFCSANDIRNVPGSNLREFVRDFYILVRLMSGRLTKKKLCQNKDRNRVICPQMGHDTETDWLISVVTCPWLWLALHKIEHWTRFLSMRLRNAMSQKTVIFILLRMSNLRPQINTVNSR
jgi:hypothetical protein